MSTPPIEPAPLSRLPLSRTVIDRDARTRWDSRSLMALRREETTRFMVYDGVTVAVTGEGNATELALLPGLGHLPSLYLGCDSWKVHYFAVDAVDLSASLSPDYRFEPLRAVGDLLSDRDTGLATNAVALAQFHARTLYCPRCGGQLSSTSGGWERTCPNGHVEYPRTDPAVIMTIVNEEDHILLGRNAAWGPGRYSTLAGFVEAGETPEAAIVREVAEETSIHIDRVEYIASQPWPFPRSLMLAYKAYTTGTDRDIAVDGVEMVHAHFFSRDELWAALETGDVRVPTRSSVARFLIEQWLGRSLGQFDNF